MKSYHSDSISIIIPAYNEEGNIRAATQNAIRAVRRVGIPYEIIIVDDGSTDRTPSLIRNLAKEHPYIKVFMHGHNRGMGAAMRTGFSAATKQYITIFLGDNDTSGDSLHKLLRERHDADMVIAYTQNPEARSIPRRIISRMFVACMNILFGMKLKYFNGFFITKREILSSIPLTSDGHTLLSEIKVRLIKKGYSYKEIPFIHTKRLHGETKAFRIKNIIATIKTIIDLAHDIYGT